MIYKRSTLRPTSITWLPALNFCCNPSALSVNLEPQNQDQCPLSTTQRGSFAKRKISYSPIDLTSSKPAELAADHLWSSGQPTDQLVASVFVCDGHFPMDQDMSSVYKFSRPLLTAAHLANWFMVPSSVLEVVILAMKTLSPISTLNYRALTL
ncbi:hypothetical protein T06_5865 [Trichinella sp. T6]|nr:hypothetical protein T06_5865 [Trichinella sp. T6]